MSQSSKSQDSPPATDRPGHVPRFALGWATGVHLLAALILGWPALTGRLLLNPRSDQFIAGFAFRDFARQFWIDHGSIPQWNPYLFGGMPFVDAMHGDTFYPTALLRLVLGTGPGMTWGLILHVFLAGLFSFAFLRSIGLSFFAALVGGVAYQMGGNIAGLVSPGHDGKLFIAALLPMALFLVVRGVRDGKHWAWGPLAIVVGLAVLSPHPQLLQYMLLLTGGFALFLALGWGSDDATASRAALTRLGPALAAVALGMVMGAIQYWPVVQYTPWSPRAGGISWDAATSYSLPPEEVLNFALPQFSGILDNYWGRNGIHFHSDYVGVVVLLLAGLGVAGWAARSMARVSWFFAGTFVTSLLWAMGGFTPFYKLVWVLVPGTRFFRAPSTMLFIVAFAASVLAAFGAERLLRGMERRTYLIVAGVAVALLGLLAFTGGLANSGLAIAGPQRADAVLANEPELKAGAIRMLLFAGLAVAAAFMVAGKRLSRDLAGTLLVGLVAADLWSVVRVYWQWAPPAAELYAPNAITEYLQKQPAPFRVATLPPTQGNARDNILIGDGLMTHRIANVMGYHGNHIGHYDNLIGAAEGYQQLGNPNFWRLANVRYFLSDKAEFPIDSSTVVAGPVADADGNTLYLHSVPVPSTYAWVTPVIVRVNNQTATAVLDPRFDVRRAGLFDSSATVQGTGLESLPAPLAIKASVTAWRAGAATIELDAPAPQGSALIVSENYYPGWTATADGKPATIGRADVSLIGVALPTGARKVELSFTNGPYETGRLVTWAAVALALVAWAAGAAVTRRQVAGG